MYLLLLRMQNEVWETTVKGTIKMPKIHVSVESLPFNITISDMSGDCTFFIK